MTSKSEKSDLSHPEEKKITKEFMNDMYGNALKEVLETKAENKEEEFDA